MGVSPVFYLSPAAGTQRGARTPLSPCLRGFEHTVPHGILSPETCSPAGPLLVLLTQQQDSRPVNFSQAERPAGRMAEPTVTNTQLVLVTGGTLRFAVGSACRSPLWPRDALNV